MVKVDDDGAAAVMATAYRLETVVAVVTCACLPCVCTLTKCCCRACDGLAVCIISLRLLIGSYCHRLQSDVINCSRFD